MGDSSTSHQVQVVSVYGSPSPYHTHHSYLPTNTKQHHTYHHRHNYHYYDNTRRADLDAERRRKVGDKEKKDSGEGREEEDVVFPPPPAFTCVWLSVVGPDGAFLNPTRLQGILGLHVQQVRCLGLYISSFPSYPITLQIFSQHHLPFP